MDLLEQKKNISNDKSALLEKWLNRNKNGQPPKGIDRRPKGKSAPLSYGQERLFFLQELFSNNAAYHFTDLLRLKGKLDISVLIQALEFIIGRHEVLRSNYFLENGKPVQKVNPEFDLEINEVDLTHLPGPEGLNSAIKQAKDFANEAFDLKSDLLLRCSLFRLGDNDQVLQVTFHHILMDAWSMPLFWQEVNAHINGKSLVPLSVQYADFAYWQHRQTPEPKSIDYWKKTLHGLQPLQLNSDYRRLETTLEGKQIKRNFSPKLKTALLSLAQKAGTTLFVILSAAFQLLLSKYSDQEDIAIGTPFTRRNKSSLEPLIGFFVNTLVLRSDLSGDPTFSELVEKVKQTMLDAFSHSQIPFEKLVEILNPARDLDQNPLFQHMLIYLPKQTHPLSITGLEIEEMTLDTGFSKFDISLFIYDGEQSLEAMIEYSTQLYEMATMNRMLGHLEILLEGIVASPHAPISHLSMLSRAEKSMILTKWAQTNAKPPKFASIHNWIADQAKKNKDKPAVIAPNGSLTYGDLEAKSSKLAAILQSKGAGSNVPIGLCTERSVDMITGILAILKSGSAFVPIDPDYPIDRIAFMLKDISAPVLLIQQHLKQSLSNEPTSMVFFDQDLDPEIKDIKNPEVTTDDLAYIIYTSGSTGRPKGVAISHENLVHSTDARFQYYAEQPDCFLLLSSFAFDSSMAGIFWTLCNGGTLLIPEKRIEQDMDRIGQIIAEKGVSHTLLLPSLYSQLLAQVPKKNLSTLKNVIVAGEACSSSLGQQHFDKIPAVKLFNEYGPTEATVWCTVHEVRRAGGQKVVPIGRPIPHSKIYILDKKLQPCPIGISGELYVGGAGLSRGYCNREELSRQHFIKNPFAENENEKMYRTGDRARFRSNGDIEFLGRADQQVKIRGHRIELSEISEIIKQYPGIKDAVVTFWKDKKDSMTEEQMIEILEEMNPTEANLLLQLIEKNQSKT